MNLKSNQQRSVIIKKFQFTLQNIFQQKFQIKQVHVVSQHQIFYEVQKLSKKQSPCHNIQSQSRYLVHQISINKDNFSQNVLQKILKLSGQEYVHKIYVECQNSLQSSHNQNQIQQVLINLLSKEQKLIFRIVITQSCCYFLDKKLNNINFVTLVNQFLKFLKFKSLIQSNDHIQTINKGILLKDTKKDSFSIHQINFYQTQKHTQQLSSMLLCIKIYIISMLSKSIKQYLSIKNKSINFLLQKFQKTFAKFPLISQFVKLMKNIITQKNQYTQKMIICYAQILKQKHFQTTEQQCFGQNIPIKLKNSIHQPPQNDKPISKSYEKPFSISFYNNSNSQNFFNNSKQSKSYSKKLKIQKQNNILNESFRHSTAKKSNSMISMSPNRKNRKYTKITTTGLFANTKQNLMKTSSSSFLNASFNDNFRNTTNSFINKNFYNTVTSNIYTSNNQFRNFDSKFQRNSAQSHMKSYLETMGFGCKKSFRRQSNGLVYSQDSLPSKTQFQQKDNIIPQRQSQHTNPHGERRQSLNFQNFTQSKVIPQNLYLYSKSKKKSSPLTSNMTSKNTSELSVQNPRSRGDPQQKRFCVDKANQKKQRLMQSLSVFQKRNSKNANLIASQINNLSNQAQNNSQLQNFSTFKQITKQKPYTNKYHQSITPQQEDDQNQSDSSQTQQGPISQTIVYKNVPPKFIETQKAYNFEIQPIRQMNIKVIGKDKRKNLKLDRATVICMHICNTPLNKKDQTSRQSRIQYSNTSQAKLLKEKKNKTDQNQKSINKPSLEQVKRQKRKQQTIKNPKQQQKNTLSSSNNKSAYSLKQAVHFKQNITQSNQQKSVIDSQKFSSLKIQKEKQKQKISAKSIMTHKQPTSRKQQIIQQELQTSYLQKTNNLNNSTSSLKFSTSFSNNKIPPSSVLSASSVPSTLTKQFFKQIFLFINSQNKTFVDLLGSKLSYQITFYSFYINYFKLNVTKTTTKQSIDKMLQQMKQYEKKILDSQKLQSQQKMVTDYQKSVKRLLKINISNFVQKYWKRHELKPNEFDKQNEQIDQLTSSILKISLKIMQQRLQKLNWNQKGNLFLLKSFKIFVTMIQFINCIENKVLSLSVQQLNKYNQKAVENNGNKKQKQLIQKVGKLEKFIEQYSTLMKQVEQQKIIKIEIKKQNKKIITLL